MCGRYVITGYKDGDEFSERFQLRHIPETLFPRFNASPAQQLPIVLEPAPDLREARFLSWGLVPRWRKPGQAGKSVAPINARAETLLEKPMFRSLVARQRCLVPASGFYEWRTINGKKQPFFFHLADDALFGFAGLWDQPPAGGDPAAPGSFTIITTAANDLVAPYHERMPVILRPEDEADWLDPDQDDPHAAHALLRPYPAEAMATHPVSPAVNSPRNDDPDLLDPITLAEEPPAEPASSSDTKNSA
jgi:putative SOS response-associated peptidase YedK